MRKVLLFVFCLFTSLVLTSCSEKETFDIVSTSYVGYDFAKEIAGDDLKCSMLLKPGEELHDYSPSVSDIEKVLNSKIFIYVGGESDSEFVEKDILKEINTKKTTVINMMDIVKTSGNIYDEEDPESYDSGDEEEEEEEYDEHIWNSITNAKIISNKIYEAIKKISNKSFEDNYDKLISNLDTLDNKFKELVNNSSKKLIVFADRFPLLYFVKEYNLEYDAAFKGCESAKEANPKTIESLTKKVIDNNLGVIFTIELSEAKIANVIVDNCKKEGKNVVVKTFYTMHNVSKEDYEKNTTYIDFMNMNYESLKVALS